MKKELRRRNFIEQLSLLHNDLERFVYTLARDNEIKNDVVQNTIEIALQKYEQLRSEDALKSWLFTIAKNEVNKYYRKTPLTVELEDVSVARKEIASNELLKDISDLLQQAENTIVIRNAIQSLDQKYQQVILLYYYEDMPLKEIAETLNINYNTIKTMHKRALKRLKDSLSEEKGGAF